MTVAKKKNAPKKKTAPKKTTPKEEESAAIRKAKRAEKARKAAAQAADRERRSKLTGVIRDTKKQYPSCKCDLRSGMSRAELIALGSGCHKNFVCPRLNAVRRKMGI